MKRERRLERDGLRYRRDKEDPKKMETMCARKQIDNLYCKACGCYIRKYQWGMHKKTAKHIRNGGPGMEEEERKMKEEEEERRGENEPGRGRGKFMVEN